MITFILILVVVLGGGAWLFFSGFNNRKRSGKAGEGQITTQHERGGGQAPTGRAS